MVKRKRTMFVIGSMLISLVTILSLYLILIVSGVVHITSTKITVVSGTCSREYNGENLVCEDFSIEDGELKKGHTFEPIFTGVQTDVGTCENTFIPKVVNSTGDDVTSQYEITSVYGLLEVKRIELTIEANSYYQNYTGEPLLADGYVVSGNKVLTHEVTAEVSGSQTTIGSSYANVDSYTIVDENGIDVSRYYDVTPLSGELVVTQIPLAVFTGGASAEYTGMSLSKSDYQVEGELLPGHSISPQTHTVGSITEIGHTYNELVLVVVDENGNDVTSMYRKDYGEDNANMGLLVVNPITIEVELDKVSKEYDGTPLVVDAEYIAEHVSGSFYKLLQGDTLSVVAEPQEITEIGKQEISYELKVNGKEDYYYFDYEKTIMEVTQIVLDISINKIEKYYDGEPLVYLNDDDLIEKYRFESGKLLSGHRIELYPLNSYGNLLDTEFTEVFNSKYQVGYRMIDENENDVTGYYTFENTPRIELAINKREIVLRPGDVSFVYDGASHSYYDQYASINGIEDLNGTLLADMKFEADVLGSKTNVYDVAQSDINPKTFKLYKGDVDVTDSENYEVTFKPGKITITKCNIVVRPKDVEREYNGTAQGWLEDDGFILKPERSIQTENFVVDADVTGTKIRQTDTGTSVIDQKSFTITNKNDENYNFDNFNFTFDSGEITITPKILIITPNDASFIYDGAVHTWESYFGADAKDSDKITGLNLLSGHKASYTVDAKLSYPGTKTVELLNFKIIDDKDKDVTSEYKITLNEGVLKVSQNSIVVTYKSYVFDFSSGTNYNTDAVHKADVSFGLVVPGTTITFSEWNSEPFENEGTYPNYASIFVVKDSTDKDVTAFYNVEEIVTGWVVIKSKFVEDVDISLGEIAKDEISSSDLKSNNLVITYRSDYGFGEEGIKTLFSTKLKYTVTELELDVLDDQVYIKPMSTKYYIKKLVLTNTAGTEVYRWEWDGVEANLESAQKTNQTGKAIIVSHLGDITRYGYAVRFVATSSDIKLSEFDDQTYHIAMIDKETGAVLEELDIKANTPTSFTTTGYTGWTIEIEPIDKDFLEMGWTENDFDIVIKDETSTNITTQVSKTYEIGEVDVEN